MGGLLLLKVPCSHAFSGVLRFWACLLPLDFSFIRPGVSRLLQPYSTDNKTSKLMAKRFSLFMDTQRCSQSYMKKSRGRKETEVSRRRKGGTREKTDRSMQLSVPRVFSVVQIHPQRFTELD